MKELVVDLELLVKDINDWGVEAELRYDEDEEAFVIHAGNKIDCGAYQGKQEITIAPGFAYKAPGQEAKIYAHPHQLYVHFTDLNPLSISLKSYIIAKSRILYHTRHKILEIKPLNRSFV